MAKRQGKANNLQWHPAFYAGMQIEFAEEAHKLTFENEHHLSTKPLQIDVLIIKKNSEEAINKNIGRIFRKHNIVEYKSPNDYISIDDYYKVYAYGYLYKALASKQNKIKVAEITITFVSEGYPRKMIGHLKNVHGYTIEKVEQGIYYVVGDIIPMQLIVTSELSEENNLWLNCLTDKLKNMSVIEKLSQEFQRHRKSELYKSMMNIIIRANNESFKEARDMCEALRELFKDEFDELESKMRKQDEDRRKLIEEMQEKDEQIKELQLQLQMLREQQA